MKYRKTNVKKWTDNLHLSMSTEQQHLFDYLNTNPYTRMCGIHPIAIDKAARQTGHTSRGFENLLYSFCRQFPGVVWLDEETKEYIMPSWICENFSSSPKTIAGIINSLKKVESIDAIRILSASIKGASLQGLKKQVSNHLRSLSAQGSVKRVHGDKVLDNQPLTKHLTGRTKELKNLRTKEERTYTNMSSKNLLSYDSENLLFPNKEIQYLDTHVNKKPEEITPKKVARKKGSFDYELLEGAKEVIKTLNDYSGRRFPSDPNGSGPANGTNNIMLVLKLYKKVGNFEDIKDMVLLMCYKWKGDPVMKQYLQPSTIFGREKSLGYVQSAVEARDNPEIKVMIDQAKEKARQSGNATDSQFGADFANAMYQTIF